MQEIVSDKPKNNPLVPTLKNTFKFIHWADIHTDFEYKLGAKTKCPQVFSCCRETSGMASSDGEGA